MLPKIKQPIFTLEIPSSGQKVKYRPFTVAEEKLLLIAKESNEQEDIVNVYKQIINNCVLDDLNVNKLAYYDIEYIFICLRSKSVSNVIEMKVKDQEDEKEYDVVLDLDKVYVSKSEVEPLIQLDCGLSVLMKHPDFETISQISELEEGDPEVLLSVISKCLNQIIEGDQVYEVQEYSPTEVAEFVNSISTRDLKRIQDFFTSLPQVTGEIEYMNSKGTKQKITLRGIKSFFGY